MAYKMKSPYRMTGNIKPPKPYSGGAKYQGEIKKAPSKATQFIRKVKNTPAGTPGTIGFLKTLGFGALSFGPLGILGKGKKLKQASKALKSAIKPKTNREKVTGMSEKYFKNVEKSFKNNPNLKKSSPGYYTIKK